MKKLLLTVAVASLALSSNAFAVEGKDGKTERARTETDKKKEQHKIEQVATPGDAAIHSEAKAIATNFVEMTRSATGTAKEVTQNRLAIAISEGILTKKDLDVLSDNNSKEVASNYSNLLSVAAENNLLRKDSNNADLGKEALSLTEFGRVEVVNNLNGKTPWTIEAEAKLNLTLIEAARAIKNGDAKSGWAAVKMGLIKAGFTADRIDQIKKECFKI